MSLRRVVDSLLAKLPEPDSFALTEAVFVRLLGLVYLCSFASFWPQIVGLVGSRGVAPAERLMQAVRSQATLRTFFELPTIFWFGISDPALIACCVFGCLAGLVMLSGYFTRIAALVCWVLYLSIAVIGQPFSNFQWDALLLEAGFLALFRGTPLLSWAYRFLLFRLMFESGVVKLTSHDTNWANLHALRYHFMTQPLPMPLAYYAYRLPHWMLDSMTLATFIVELIVPFFLFAPKRLRYPAVGLLVFLQIVILLTGNYAFFNLLTLALCLWGLDDSAFIAIERPMRLGTKIIRMKSLRMGLSTVLAFLILLGGVELLDMLTPVFRAPMSMVGASLGPFEIVNTYGLFAIMTTTRPEVIIEGSNDGEHWKEYSFRFKPGDLHRSLPIVAPYQPRLDWQMWFAALGSYQQNAWVGGLLYRMMTGEASVLKLLGPPPFPKPPKYVRALLYDYEFTTPSERARTGAVWQRKLITTWFGPASLTGT